MAEVDFEHVSKLFEVLKFAHEHGLHYRNIFIAAKKELDAIEEELNSRPISINLNPQPNAAEVDDEEEEEEDDE